MYAEGNKTEPDVAWYAEDLDNSYGPITALTALQERTSKWKNLPQMTIDEFEDNNGTVKTLSNSFTMHARLPKYSEIKIMENGGTMPTWLHINLNGRGDNNVNGYWTSTASSSDSERACFVSYNGAISAGNVYIDSLYGVRPVIELYK